MADGILSRFPNLTGLVQTSTSIESGVNSLLATFSTNAQGSSASPLASVATALQGLNSHLSIDMSGLTTQFPAALDVMRNVLPPGSLDYVRSIETAYREAQDFLTNSALVREIRPGSSLQETALGIITEVLREFDNRRQRLTANLIDPDALQGVTTALTAFNQFRTDFAAHRDNFLPFLSQNLLGVGPDILRAPLEHLAAARTVLAPLQPSAVEAVLGVARQAVAVAFRDLTNAVLTLDPADNAGYTLINDKLNEVETAIHSLNDALAPLYLQLETLIGSHAWDTIFSTLNSLLQAVAVTPSFSMDAIIHHIADIMDSLLARLQMVVGPQDLVQQIEALSRQINDTFSTSALGQVRRVLRDFLEQIRHAIETVPTGQIQQTIEAMLNRVRQEIDALGLSQLSQTIEQAFGEVETFITTHINQALRDQVQATVRSVLASFFPDDTAEDRRSPIQKLIESLASSINTAIRQVQDLLTTLENALQGSMDQLSGVAAQLEGLSFRPVSETVIGEINELKTRLQAINPNALSDAEKLAIRGALAVLEALDLEGFITTNVKSGFTQAKNEVKSILDDLTAVLHSLSDRLDAYNPRELVTPLVNLLDQAQTVTGQLDAKALLQPLYQQATEFAQRLQSLSPGPLLDPLQQPYQAVLDTVNQLNPDQLIAPLNTLYAQINALIDHVDVTPILNELDRRQKELFTNVRNSLLTALDGLSLPEPLAGFLGGMRPVLQAMTEAIFQSADTELHQMSLDLRTRFNIASLFTSLDQAFDELKGMVESVPEDDLLSTFETLRRSVGVGLEALNPHNLMDMFRAGQRQLTDLSPSLLFAMPLGLSNVRLAFETRVEGAPGQQQGVITSTLARFDAVLSLVSPVAPQSLIAPLVTAHGALEATLRRHVNALNPATAEAAYGALRDTLFHLLPDFLRSTTTLTRAEILAGVESLRPSRKADELQRVLDRFLQHLQPMQAALESATNSFFGTIRDALALLNPLSLKDAVADIYTAIRQKVRVLDPDSLAASLRTSIFDPLMSALRSIDPAALKTRLDHAFQTASHAITDNITAILDEIASAFNQLLQSLRQAVKTLVDQIKATINAAAQIFEGLVHRVEHLVFIEILERLQRVTDSLGISFDRELDRVRSAFDEMLAAIPLGGSSRSAAVSV